MKKLILCAMLLNIACVSTPPEERFACENIDRRTLKCENNKYICFKERRYNPNIGKFGMLSWVTTNCENKLITKTEK
jgi:hypothetical protein